MKGDRLLSALRHKACKHRLNTLDKRNIYSLSIQQIREYIKLLKDKEWLLNLELTPIANVERVSRLIDIEKSIHQFIQK